MQETATRVKNCFLLSKTKQLSKMLKMDAEKEDAKKYGESKKRLVLWAQTNVEGADKLSKKEVGKALEAALDAYAEEIGEA